MFRLALASESSTACEESSAQASTRSPTLPTQPSPRSGCLPGLWRAASLSAFALSLVEPPSGPSRLSATWARRDEWSLGRSLRASRITCWPLSKSNDPWSFLGPVRHLGGTLKPWYRGSHPWLHLGTSLEALKKTWFLGFTTRLWSNWVGLWPWVFSFSTFPNLYCAAKVYWLSAK